MTVITVEKGVDDNGREGFFADVMWFDAAWTRLHRDNLDVRLITVYKD